MYMSQSRGCRKRQKHSSSDHFKSCWPLGVAFHVLDRMQLIVLISYAGNLQVPKALVSHYSSTPELILAS